MTAVRAGACAWTAGILIAAALPAPSSRWFDGLPWTSLPEVALLAAALAVLGSRAAQDRIGHLSSVHLPAPLRWWGVGLPVMAAGLNLAAGSLAPPASFAACYGTLVPRVEAPPCERSFDAPFATSRVTRYDPTLDFAGNWHLGFVNSRRFNFHRTGQMVRQRLPFRAAWSGTVNVEDGERLEIRYVGEGLVQVGPAIAVLPSQYAGETVALMPPAGRHRFVASYRYDDGSRDGREPAGGAAEFRVEVVGADGTRQPLRVQPARAAMQVLVRGYEAVLLLSIVILGAGLAGRVRLLLAGALGVAWLVFTVGAGLGPWQLFLPLTLAALAAAWWPAAVRPGVLVPVAIALAAGAARQRVASFADMHVRGGGQDWLTYESFARTILETWSLEGGEALFYYQPLYRYAKFFLRLLFGEGDALVLTALNTGLFGGVLVLTAVLARCLPRRVRLMAVVTAAAMFALVCSNWAQSVVYRGLSEPLAWAFYPFAIALLFGGGGFGRQAVGMVMAGACAVTRMNHLPAIIVTAGTFFARRGQRRPAWLLAAVLSLVLLLPLAHNLAYGGAFVLTTTSAGIPNNVAINPSRLLDLPWQAETREALTRQVGLMFFLGRGWWNGDVLLVGIRLSQVLWAGAIAVALWRRTVYHALVALLPLSYLAAHVVYELHVYYPRHIIAPHLAMAVSVCLAILPRSDPSGSG